MEGADLLGANLDAADLRFADFRSFTLFSSDSSIFEDEETKGLTTAQLKAAKNWDKAYYDDDVVKQLGLPPDHNQKLAEEQKREEQQKGQPAANAPASIASQPGAGQDKSANAP